VRHVTWFLLVSLSVHAQEGIEYGFGTSRLGAVSSAGALSVLNPCSGVQRLSGTTVDVDSTAGFAAGDLVMFHHTQASGDAGVVDLSVSTVGRYFFRRITAVSGNRLTLDRPVEMLTPGVVQIVRVIEAERFDLYYNQTVAAPPWDGRCGGIIAALVSDTLWSDGHFDAVGRGFRGADAVSQPASSGMDCVGTSTSLVGPGYAPAGEGFVAGTWGVVGGSGFFSSGGGGGVCVRSGGGGGSNLGRGGSGGFSFDGNRPVGGLGGATTVFDPQRRAFFGGGGGGGHLESATTRGGNGGGFIWVRARTIDGSYNSRFVASGNNGADSFDGGTGGGGGAGGTIVIQAFDVKWSIISETSGARGGSVRAPVGRTGGPGGGGGGGVISTWFNSTWPLDTSPGPEPVLSQYVADGGRVSLGPAGATAGGAGRSGAIVSRFSIPDGGVDAGTVTVLELTSPVEGAVLRERRPRAVGAGASGMPVSLTLDGQPFAMMLPDSEGRFEATAPTDLPDGPHEFVAQQGSTAVSRRFSVDLLPPPAPTITSPRPRAVFSESPGLVRGTAEVGSRVSLFINDSAEGGEAMAQADGGFVWVIASPLDDGDHTISAVCADAAGNVSDRSEAVTFKVASRLGKPIDATVRAGCSEGHGLFQGLALLLLGLTGRRRPPT
jgi:large repetitive protein